MLIKFWSGKFSGKFKESTTPSFWIRDGVGVFGPRYDMQVGDLGVSHLDYNSIQTLIPITKKEIKNNRPCSHSTR